ncbi:MAG: hypothetical protein JKY70_03215 [Mucilaginibacter sp.]|nr:hypothetical protein [Mucilaginibacter sp.]
MTNYYYLFWCDGIQRFEKHHPKERRGAKKTLVVVSWTFTLAVLCTLLWLKYFHVYETDFGVLGIFTVFGKKQSLILDMALVFIVIYVINYLLIFRRNRYRLFIKKYPLGRFNYSGFIALSMLAYYLCTIFLYCYLTGQK